VAVAIVTPAAIFYNCCDPAGLLACGAASSPAAKLLGAAGRAEPLLKIT